MGSGHPRLFIRPLSTFRDYHHSQRISSMRDPNRRVFLRNSASVLLAGRPVFAMLERNAPATRWSSPLKSEAQYRSEAGQFESALRDLAAAASLPTTTATEIANLTGAVARAGLGIDYHDSWMVTIAVADSALVAWVRKEIRDEATLRRFVETVKRDPRFIYSIPGITTLSARLDQLKAQKLAVISKIISKEKEIAGLESSTEAAVRKAQEVQECAKTWSIVTAVLLVVVAIIVATIAIVTAAFSTSTVDAGAQDLAITYRGTGAELVRNAFSAANSRYAACVAQANLLPPISRTKALAACQAKWLAEKAAFVG
jgi:hypothetical protein